MSTLLEFLDEEPSKPNWTKEWVGMPQFDQEKQTPFAEMTIRFASKEDLDAFSKLIDQKLTPKTKSLWHPQLVRGIYSHLKYVDAT